jgi:hypothetical protein
MKMTYEQARELIQDGDIISFFKLKSNGTLTSNIISFFTKSEIYHTAMAVWLTSDNGERRLFVVEADPANRLLVPLSVFSDHNFTVLAKPDYVDFKKISPKLINKVGTAKYSYLKAINSGIRQYFNFPVLASTGEFCSELVLKMWQLGGFKINDTLLDPTELEKVLIEDHDIKYRCKVGS